MMHMGVLAMSGLLMFGMANGNGDGIVIGNGEDGEEQYQLFPLQHVVGVGDGSKLSFSGQLTPPVYPGSLTITDGTETFEDAAGNGILESNYGGTGAVNYNTGSFTVNFTVPPSEGREITATYLYVSHDGEPPDVPDPIDVDDPDETVLRIHRLTVWQDGNVLTLTDNNGREFNGRMGRVEGAGGDTSGQTAGKVIAHFEADGHGIRMVGVFEGQYMPPVEDRPDGAMVDRRMRGTWFTDEGMRGNIELSAD